MLVPLIGALDIHATFPVQCKLAILQNHHHSKAAERVLFLDKHAHDTLPRNFGTIYYQVVKRMSYTGNLLVNNNLYLEMYITAGPKKMAKDRDKNDK